MRFKSQRVDGFRIFAVSGTNTVSFGIEATAAARKGLLGFGVERDDPKENETYRISGYKVFPSVIPHPDEQTQPSTMDHPIQSFVWDDFTAKDDREYTYRFYPLRGKPKQLDRKAKPVPITIRTEPLFSRQTHDVFFNRGVASSQAYAKKYQNKKPEDLPPAKKAEALEWLSRKLDDAILKFISNAKANETLLCCFYEFRYQPVAAALKAALDRGVRVRLILDGKDNSSTDKNGKFHEAFPSVENRQMVATVGLPGAAVIWREAKPADIQHNKFMVLLKGTSATPKEVWTGSTNISNGGIHGQTNVGHWVRDAQIAQAYADYWTLLAGDPGSQAGDDRSTALRKNAALKQAVQDLRAVPLSIDDIPSGVSAVFSPRGGSEVLKLYVDLLDSAQDLGCITLAFGINKLFKDKISDNSDANALIFAMLEKEDRPNKDSKDPFIYIGAKQNVYKAWGSFLRDPLYQWVRETNAGILGLNQHVSYVHSKFLLRDPLGDDPIVVTGSANFSDASTNSNDENMLIIRGDRRVADIYFTEFNRIFQHYYYRSVVEATARRQEGSETEGSLFLKETAAAWQVKYKPGSYKSKRLAAFLKMKIS